MEIEKAKEDLREIRARQSLNKNVTLAEIQSEYDQAERALTAAKARLDAVIRKARERIPASEAKYQVGNKVWVVSLRLYGTVTKILGFTVFNGILGAMYEVETSRKEVYHELLLRGER